MATRPDKYERSAAGMDFDTPFREKASQLGAALAENGPDALFDEIENLLPDAWREQIASFPLTAVILGVGVGVWLGLRKGEEILAAGTTLITTAAMANVSSVMDSLGGSGE
jgi:hypothetical protein